MPSNSNKKSSRRAKILPQFSIYSGNKPLLDLLEIQRKSFFDLLQYGIAQELGKVATFRETAKNSTCTRELELVFNPDTYKVISPDCTPKQAILKGKTYACKLYVQATLTVRSLSSIPETDPNASFFDPFGFSAFDTKNQGQQKNSSNRYYSTSSRYRRLKKTTSDSLSPSLMNATLFQLTRVNDKHTLEKNGRLLLNESFLKNSQTFYEQLFNPYCFQDSFSSTPEHHFFPLGGKNKSSSSKNERNKLNRRKKSTKKLNIEFFNQITKHKSSYDKPTPLLASLGGSGPVKTDASFILTNLEKKTIEKRLHTVLSESYTSRQIFKKAKESSDLTLALGYKGININKFNPKDRYTIPSEGVNQITPEGLERTSGSNRKVLANASQYEVDTGINIDFLKNAILRSIPLRYIKSKTLQKVTISKNQYKDSISVNTFLPMYTKSIYGVNREANHKLITPEANATNYQLLNPRGVSSNRRLLNTIDLFTGGSQYGLKPSSYLNSLPLSLTPCLPPSYLLWRLEVKSQPKVSKNQRLLNTKGIYEVNKIYRSNKFKDDTSVITFTGLKLVPEVLLLLQINDLRWPSFWKKPKPIFSIKNFFLESWYQGSFLQLTKTKIFNLPEKDKHNSTSLLGKYLRYPSQLMSKSLLQNYFRCQQITLWHKTISNPTNSTSKKVDSKANFTAKHYLALFYRGCRVQNQGSGTNTSILAPIGITPTRLTTSHRLVTPRSSQLITPEGFKVRSYPEGLGVSSYQRLLDIRGRYQVSSATVDQLLTPRRLRRLKGLEKSFYFPFVANTRFGETKTNFSPSLFPEERLFDLTLSSHENKKFQRKTFTNACQEFLQGNSLSLQIPSLGVPVKSPSNLSVVVPYSLGEIKEELTRKGNQGSQVNDQVNTENFSVIEKKFLQWKLSKRDTTTFLKTPKRLVFNENRKEQTNFSFVQHWIPKVFLKKRNVATNLYYKIPLRNKTYAFTVNPLGGSVKTDVSYWQIASFDTDTNTYESSSKKPSLSTGVNTGVLNASNSCVDRQEDSAPIDQAAPKREHKYKVLTAGRYRVDMDERSNPNGSTGGRYQIKSFNSEVVQNCKLTPLRMASQNSSATRSNKFFSLVKNYVRPTYIETVPLGDYTLSKNSAQVFTDVNALNPTYVRSVSKNEKLINKAQKKKFLVQKNLRLSSSKSQKVTELTTNFSKTPNVEENKKNKNVQIFRPWIFLGELPLMTKRGHFILNGSPRVIVNQIARCPGIYFQEKRRGVGFEQEVRVSADIIPQRGPWLRIQSDWEGRFWARLKQEGRVKYATLYEAFQEFEKQYNAPLVSLVVNSSSSFSKSEMAAFQERKGKEERQKKALVRLFKNSVRYSLGKLGRFRINQRVHSIDVDSFAKTDFVSKFKGAKSVYKRGSTDLNIVDPSGVVNAGLSSSKISSISNSFFPSNIRETFLTNSSIRQKKHLVPALPIQAISQKVIWNNLTNTNDITYSAVPNDQVQGHRYLPSEERKVIWQEEKQVKNGNLIHSFLKTQTKKTIVVKTRETSLPYHTLNDQINGTSTNPKRVSKPRTQVYDNRSSFVETLNRYYQLQSIENRSLENVQISQIFIDKISKRNTIKSIRSALKTGAYVFRSLTKPVDLTYVPFPWKDSMNSTYIENVYQFVQTKKFLGGHSLYAKRYQNCIQSKDFYALPITGYTTNQRHSFFLKVKKSSKSTLTPSYPLWGLRSVNTSTSSSKRTFLSFGEKTKVSTNGVGLQSTKNFSSFNATWLSLINQLSADNLVGMGLSINEQFPLTEKPMSVLMPFGMTPTRLAASHGLVTERNIYPYLPASYPEPPGGVSRGLRVKVSSNQTLLDNQGISEQKKRQFPLLDSPSDPEKLAVKEELLISPLNGTNFLLMAKDVDAVHTCLERLLEGQGFTDDIDHLKNRFIRTSGKLLQQQFELGLHRLNEVMTPLLKNLIQGSSFSSFSNSVNIDKPKDVSTTVTALTPSGSVSSSKIPLVPKVGKRSKKNGEKPMGVSYQPLKSLVARGEIDKQKHQLMNNSGQFKPFDNFSKVLTSTKDDLAWNKRQNVTNKVVTSPFRWLRTSKPVNGAFREFFGSNPLSQYMDQSNPLAEITHKRRLSSMGPGGIKRETAGMEVRGIHPTHYGRICPIETPEGKNAGLVNSPTVYGRVGNEGFMETPLYQVIQSQVQTKRWAFFSAQQEEDEETSLATCDTGLIRFNLLSHVPIPVQTANNPLTHFQQVERNRVGYRALSPVQTISVATALIPFLEHDDANRALMGSNMQRQAIPLLLPERPIVGTGFEPIAIVESGQALQATQTGYVSHISARKIILHTIHSVKGALAQNILRNCTNLKDIKGMYGLLTLTPGGDKKVRTAHYQLLNPRGVSGNRRLLNTIDLLTGGSQHRLKANLGNTDVFNSKANRGLPTFAPKVHSQYQVDSTANNKLLTSKVDHRLTCLRSSSSWNKKLLSTKSRYRVEKEKFLLQKNLRFPCSSIRTLFDLDVNTDVSYFGSVANHDTRSVYGVELLTLTPGGIITVDLCTDPKGVSAQSITTVGLEPTFGSNQKLLDTESLYEEEKRRKVQQILNQSKKVPDQSPTKLHLCSTHNALILKTVEQTLEIYQRSNQETCLSQRPLVQEGDWVKKGDFVADCSASCAGDLSLGKNVTVAYMPWEGYNFEDAIVISNRLVADDVYTSIHIERYEIKISKNSQGKERITNQIPSLPSRSLKHLDNSGVAQVSSWVQPGDILVGKVVELKRPLSPYERLAWELASRLSPTSPEREKWLNKVWLEDISLRLPPGVCGRVINSQVVSTEWSEKEQIVHPLEVHIYLAVKRKIQVGDKLAGRHGNKGIVSIILPRQDMPYLADGSNVDMVLNPLGVPSRMNLGQIFECLLGLAGSQLGCNFRVTPFDEIAGGEASRSLVFLKLYQCRLIYKQQWLFTPTFPGKCKLFDGRTGEPFENWVTVGQAYMLKLIHMVDHKIHARSTGPYSLFTRQPVRGRSRRGGQRLGEMEVWAVEGFGAAYTLQEFLTIKSDDLKARTALQRSFYKQNDVTLGKVQISPGNPEAFKVLVSELQALCLHIHM